MLVYGNNSAVEPLYYRRDLAPHLKSLMGPWWFSQFDPISEVSLAAKRSLQVRNHFFLAAKFCFC